MSLLGAFVRDVVEPVALSILQWAWTFDPGHTAPAFTLPFRFYAYSATSILLWLYELLPHWLLLTLLILGTFSVLVIALLIFCYPFRLLHRCFVVIFKLSLLLFRCVAVGIVRLGYWLYLRRCAIPRVCRRRQYQPRFEVRIPPAVIRPAILDRTTAALAPPPPIRAFPAVAPESNATDNGSLPTRNTRRRQPRTQRR